MEYTDYLSDRVKPLKASAIREMFKRMADPEIISLAGGNPAAELFPGDELSKIAGKILMTNPTGALQYGTTDGYAPMKECAKERAMKADSFNDGDSIIVTTGAQPGIDLAAKCLLNVGDKVVVESPSFIGTLNSLRSYQADLIGVEVENDGINVEKLEDALKNNDVKLMYLIPTFQNPSGITMSLQKRKAVLEIAKKYRVPILEDNPYGELRFAGSDVPTIKSMDDEGIVIYCGSFSKVLSAGMRVGFLCAQKELISKVVVVKQTNDVHTNQFFQMLCSKFISQYGLDDHIAGIRKLYRENCECMLENMDNKFPENVSFTRPQGGLFLWVTLPEGQDSAIFAKLAAQNEVAVVPGATFLTDTNSVSRSFRMNYSMPTKPQIEKGVDILAKLMKNM